MSMSLLSILIPQAFGGLMVSVTMKYADNILKSFATSVSIILSTFLSSMLLGNTVPSNTFLVGTGIVLFASAMYGLAPTDTSVKRYSYTGAVSDIKKSASFVQQDECYSYSPAESDGMNYDASGTAANIVPFSADASALRSEDSGFLEHSASVSNGELEVRRIEPKVVSHDQFIV